MHLFQRDFDQLEPGQTFSTRGRTITEADVVGFATLTGDLHPQHVDAAWAAESPFGRRIAHGMLVMSYAIGLVPLDPERVVALRRVRDVVFKRPVALGDTIHVEGSVEELTALDDETGLVACVWQIKNQRGRLVVRARVEVLWRRGGADAAAVSTNGKAALEALPLTI
jgi:3-hydroxybutyryl-CoA dehydratase